jgi:hypothetical protein
MPRPTVASRALVHTRVLSRFGQSSGSPEHKCRVRRGSGVEAAPVRERELSASPYKPSPGEKADARPQTILWTMGMNIIRSTVINEDLLRDVERFNESMGCLTTLLNSLTM